MTHGLGHYIGVSEIFGVGSVTYWWAYVWVGNFENFHIRGFAFTPTDGGILTNFWNSCCSRN